MIKGLHHNAYRCRDSEETRRFYEKAAGRARDASIRQLLDDLANEEREHETRAQELDLPDNVKADEEVAQRRLFVLQIVQPGLAGLMDGSVSTLAPVFAAAFATQKSWDAFLVGLAASVGAGISMGFAEALSDDGSLTGRGHPWLRGLVCGLMTTLGGIGHTLPFLIPDFRAAMTAAIVVVLLELAAITWIRNHYMDTPPLSAAIRVNPMRPASSSARSGRLTLLCSRFDVMTLSPSASTPLKAMFRASVQLSVKTNRSGSLPWKSWLSKCRQSSRTRSEARAILWPARPGLARLWRAKRSSAW